MPLPVLSSKDAPRSVWTSLGADSGAGTPDHAIQTELWAFGSRFVKDLRVGRLRAAGRAGSWPLIGSVVNPLSRVRARDGGGMRLRR